MFIYPPEKPVLLVRMHSEVWWIITCLHSRSRCCLIKRNQSNDSNICQWALNSCVSVSEWQSLAGAGWRQEERRRRNNLFSWSSLTWFELLSASSSQRQQATWGVDGEGTFRTTSWLYMGHSFSCLTWQHEFL